MGQVTWRAPDTLIQRVQHLAAAEGLSMNEFVSRVLTLATDTDESDPPALRLRARLRAAGLLAVGYPSTPRPSADELTLARAAAGTGTPVSDLVASLRE